MFEEDIGKNLKLLRVSLDLTQEQLARKVGLTRQTIIAIESKKKKPSRVQALALLSVLRNSEYAEQILGHFSF